MVTDANDDAVDPVKLAVDEVANLLVTTVVGALDVVVYVLAVDVLAFVVAVAVVVIVAVAVVNCCFCCC